MRPIRHRCGGAMDHRSRYIAIGFIFALASLVTHAGQVPESDPGWQAPAQAAARANPLANRPDAAAGGRKLFQQRCANCHGEDRRGSEKGPDLTRAGVLAQSDGALFWKITQGNTRGGMPTFSFLPEAQRWQLVLHLRSNGTGREASRAVRRLEDARHD